MPIETQEQISGNCPVLLGYVSSVGTHVLTPGFARFWEEIFPLGITEWNFDPTATLLTREEGRR